MDPNVDLTESRTASVESECLFFIIALIVTSVLRVFARTQSKAGLWWDDYLSFVALVCEALQRRLRLKAILPLFTAAKGDGSDFCDWNQLFGLCRYAFCPIGSTWSDQAMKKQGMALGNTLGWLALVEHYSISNLSTPTDWYTTFASPL